jgi:hypothetical protein
MVQSCVYLSSAIRYVDIHQFSAGIIHLALNMLAQMTASAQVQASQLKTRLQL